MDRDRARTDRSSDGRSSRPTSSSRAAPPIRTDGGAFYSSPQCHTCGAVLDRRDRYCPQCGTGQGSARGRFRRKLRGVAQRGQDLLYGALGWTLVLLSLPALAIAFGAALQGALAGTLVALAWFSLLLGAGVLVNPRFGRQLSRRHAPTTVGRVRSVDHRVVDGRDGPVEPCTVCGERFGVGVVRRRRDEFVLAGLPIYTADVGYNHYCAHCEETGRFGHVDAPDDGDSSRDGDGVATPADEPAGLLEAGRDAAIEACRAAAIAAGRRAALGVVRRVGARLRSDDAGSERRERDDSVHETEPVARDEGTRDHDDTTPTARDDGATPDDGTAPDDGTEREYEIEIEDRT